MTSHLSDDVDDNDPAEQAICFMLYEAWADENKVIDGRESRS